MYYYSYLYVPKELQNVFKNALQREWELPPVQFILLLFLDGIELLYRGD
jgi:hypothetical protein